MADDGNNNPNSNISSNNPHQSQDGKVDRFSYGRVHKDDVTKECWMLRIPPKLAEVWDKAPEGMVLGELVFKKGGKPTKRMKVNPTTTTTTSKTGRSRFPPPRPPPGSIVKPSLSIQVNPSTTLDDPTVPLHYDLSAMTKKVPTMHPFIRHPNGSVTVKGTVTRTANLQVHQINDSNYRKLCKNRLLQTTVNASRYVKPVESNQVVQQSRPKHNTKSYVPSTSIGNGISSSDGINGNGSNNGSDPNDPNDPNNEIKHKSKLLGLGGGFGNAVHLYGKRLLDAANAPTPTKKAKFADDQPTKSVIFQLFTQQQYWTVKDLKQASGGRPETEIRDILREIGDYHRSGDHKNTWELRKEFQKQTM